MGSDRNVMRMLGAFALTLLLACSCSRGPTQAEKAAAEGVIVIGNKVEPSSLDPHLTTSVEEGNIERALFEGLVAPNPETLAPEPALATDWEESEDGQTYTFHLRPGLQWSDGTPIRSGDVLFSWRRLIEPGLASVNAELLFCVKGAKSFNEGKSQDFASVGIHTPDDATVVVTLERRTPWFLSILMHTSLAVLPETIIRASGEPFARANGWTRSAELACSGPFVVKRWESGRVIELARNPHYWDAASVRLSGIQFLPIESINVEDTAFLGGQLHVTDTVPVGKIAFLRRQGNPALHIEPYLGVYYYALNTTRPPLDNANVRRALSLAIDRRAIAVNLLGGAQREAKSFCPALEGYAPPEILRGDATLARQLLADAGYPGGKGFPRIELLYNTSENHRMIAEAVQAMWKENLGIDADLRNEDFNSYLGSRSGGDYEVIRAGWVADYPSEFSFLDLLLSNAGNNFAKWKNPDYDRLVQEAKDATSPDEARALAKRAETLLLGEAPIIPIYHYNTTRQISPAVHGWHANPMDWHPWKTVWVEPPKQE
ncbi:MAG TPA: peptide ABC transporter substrate-binding protein [Opitutales bacterium]|nr:peptide ABC transporter substrate-binding protein [Opitutales bacterium]